MSHMQLFSYANSILVKSSKYTYKQNYYVITLLFTLLLYENIKIVSI